MSGSPAPRSLIELGSTTRRDSVPEHRTLAGGPSSLLDALERLHVHVAAADHPDQAEATVLRQFMASVAPRAQGSPERPLVAAAVREPGTEQGDSQASQHHRSQGGSERSPLVDSTPPGHEPVASNHRRPKRTHGSVAEGCFGYGVHAKRDASRYRRGSSPSNQRSKEGVGAADRQDHPLVSVRGEMFTVPWDPRLGPDKERSGLIRVGKDNMVRLLGAPRRSSSIRTPRDFSSSIDRLAATRRVSHQLYRDRRRSPRSPRLTRAGPT